MGGLLIVDDENILRNGLRVMIEDFNLALSPIMEAENGLRALEIIAEQQPQVILLDIVMPHMNGIELLKAIKEQGIDCNVIVLSGHSEFEYAKEAIRYRVFEYLLKPVKREELENALKNVLASLGPVKKHKLNDNFPTRSAVDLGSDLLSGVWLNRMSFSEFQSRNKILLPLPLFYTVYLQVSADSPEMEDDITADFTSALKKEYTYTFVIPDQCGRQMVVINTTEQMDSVASSMRTLHNKFLKKHCNTSLGLSGVRDHADDVPHLFKEAKIAFTERILVGSGKLNIYDAVSSKNNQVSVSDIEITKIITMLEVGDIQALEAFLNTKYCAGNLSGRATIKNVQDSYCSILLQVASNFVGVTKAAEFMTGVINRFFEQLLECMSLHDSNGKLLSALIEISGENSRDSESFSRRKAILLAKQFIINNYDKNINLDMIANHVSMNFAYFSVLFKKIEGISLTEFIVNIRINKAKSFLAYPHYKIYEIAEMTGFQDVKYFSKVFKRKVGITPLEYREKCMAANDG